MANNPYIVRDHVKEIENLPLTNLRKIKNMETGTILFSLTCIVFSLIIFFTINYVGLENFPTFIRIQKIQWGEAIRRGYILSWTQIAILIVLLLIRQRIRKLMVVPLTQREKLMQKQVYGNQELISEKNLVENEGPEINDEDTSKNLDSSISSGSKPNDAPDTEFGDIDVYLRNSRSFKYVLVLSMVIVFGYINYFPRGYTLFSSYWEDLDANPTLGFIFRPSEFFTFFILNIIFSLMIVMLFLFLLGFSLRKVKDIDLFMKKRVKNAINFNRKKLNREKGKEWKPVLTKPWNLMTLEERKNYNLEMINNKKKYVNMKNRQKIRELIDEEKEKMKLGNKRYKQKKKKEKELAKIEKKKDVPEQIKPPKLEEDDNMAYDFR